MPKRRFKGMPWFEVPSDEIDDPHIQELIARFSTRGYFLRDHLNRLLARHFNVYAPGSYRFTIQSFSRNFIPPLRSKREVFEIMDFLMNDINEIWYKIDGNRIEITSHLMEKRASRYTKNVLSKLEKEQEEEGGK